MARALIVGCGCRGQALGKRLVAPGWLIRGTTRDPADAAKTSWPPGWKRWSLTRIASRSILDQVGDVTVVFWLLGSAVGEPARSRRSTARGWSA